VDPEGRRVGDGTETFAVIWAESAEKSKLFVATVSAGGRTTISRAWSTDMPPNVPSATRSTG